MEKEKNEQKMESLTRRKSECEAIKANNARDIEVRVVIVAMH